MAITVTAITNEINSAMNRWRRTHQAFSAYRVLSLSDAFKTLYVSGLISECSNKRNNEFIFSCVTEIRHDYECTEDKVYKKELKDYFYFSGVRTGV